MNSSMEERNDEWGIGCSLSDGKCFECGECEPNEQLQNCPTCGGIGRHWDFPCVDCEGTGHVDF